MSSVYLLKVQKIDRIGAGQRIEVFETSTFKFMCPYKALMKYITLNNVNMISPEPLFREENGECLTGRKMNNYLEKISVDLQDRGMRIKNHSLRAGVPTMMAALGYPDTEIKAAGKWQSQAFLTYRKMPRLHRAKFAAELSLRVNQL